MKAEGSVLKYVTKAECRKYRSSLPFIKHPVFLALQFHVPYKYMGSKTPKVRKIGKKVQFFLYTPAILQCKDINKTVLQEKHSLCPQQVSSSFTLLPLSNCPTNSQSLTSNP